MEPSFHQHQARRVLFDTDVATYRDGRPGYPQAVFDLLRERCGLWPDARVLEIGPGTGQATGPLLNVGAKVVAVEIGPGMAQSLSETNQGRDLTVLVGSFEDVAASAGQPAPLEDETFDIVAAATSFHWVPAAAGLTIAHRLLKPGGSLALWWNYYGDPERPDPFHEAIQPLMEARAPELTGQSSASGAGLPYAIDVPARVAEIDASGLFGPVEHHVIPWTGRHSPQEIRRMFGSFSPWLAVAPEIREPLLDELENLATERFASVVERPYLTPVYLARKAARWPQGDGQGDGDSVMAIGRC